MWMAAIWEPSVDSPSGGYDMPCSSTCRGSTFLPVILTFPFLTFLAGCAGTTEFVPTAGLENEKLSSRPTPAQVSQESEETLIKKGVVAIQFDSAGPFVDGRALVGPGDKRGLIDMSGQWLPER